MNCTDYLKCSVNKYSNLMGRNYHPCNVDKQEEDYKIIVCLIFLLSNINCQVTFAPRCILKSWNSPTKLKLILKNTTTDKTLTHASETWTLTKRDRKQLNIFERKVYRRILGPVCNNEKENGRILTNKEISASVKKPTLIETITLNRLCWLGHVQRME